MITALRKVKNMASVSVSEGGVTFPKWLVVTVATGAVLVSIAAGGAFLDTQSKAQSAIETNIKQDARLDRLETAMIEQGAMRADIAALQKQQDKMDAKLDRLLDAQGRRGVSHD